MLKQECNPVNTATARGVLESALVVQFRKLADGLLADLLLRGDVVDDLRWWHQYLASLSEPSHHCPQLSDPGFLAFRRRFIQDVAKGNTRRITRPMLNEIDIRVYSGTVKLAEEGRINRQLTRLGSNLRIVMIGCQQSRVSRIRQLLEKEPQTLLPIDGRFIFGRVAPITVSSKATALFDYEKELAVSPYLPGNTTGFKEGARIVIRQATLRMEEEVRIQARDADPAHYQERLRVARAAVRVHEESHVSFGQLLSGFAPQISESHGDDPFWSVIREDICRFAQTPRTTNEIVQLICDFLDPKRLEGTQHATQRRQIRTGVGRIIREMQEEKLLTQMPSGRIKCSQYDDTSRWRIT